MTLAEKLTVLRGERKLSQGDLAERLDVSRQSVSKWETGQAVPELDKIIKLADLFGVTVDELVRDTQAPSPEAAKAEVTERVVYIEKPRPGLTPIQILGVVCMVSGAVTALLALYGGDPELVIIGSALLILSLPLLLAKKHPLLIDSWILWVVGYFFLCTPFFTGNMTHWQPFTGLVNSLLWLIQDGHEGGSILVVILFLLLLYAVLSVLTILLPILTMRLWLRKRRETQQAVRNADG